MPLAVAEEGIVDAAQFFRPFSMTFKRIDADAENFGILGEKLLCHLAEPSHLRGR